MGAEGQNVILVGFMGAGKSVVGRLLARRLGLCFVETDDMIVAREGKPIPQIFAERGEAYFRALEAEVLDLLAEKRGHVIATGGGFPCGDGVMERLRALGTVVWLDGDVERLLERAQRTGGRPMLAGRSREEVLALYRQREACYARAHARVDTSALGIDAVVGRVLRLLAERQRDRAAPAG